MARIWAIEITNFRGIKEFQWFPSSGLNCLIGPGDSGKSSILDAIDLCIGARRNVQFTDADFHQLDVTTPLSISITIGQLDDALKNLDTYGIYLRGFNHQSKTIEDEPEKEAETVLTIRLTVASDLEPVWSLISERAEALGQTRNLSWSDRVRLAPTRIGVVADYHLGWRRGSVLNRISEERVNVLAALTDATRDARNTFGDKAQEQLAEALDIVASTAENLGISVGNNIKAMLDVHSISFSSGTIALHNEWGVPLRGLGVGSTRLLIAGLQRKAAEQSTIILIDELEPHRIIRLLGSLGAKDPDPPLQVFMTTHSPVALRELSGSQLFVIRQAEGKHQALPVGAADDVQSTMRLYPEAFLAPSIIICEGASEVGLVRGLDQYRVTNGHNAISAQGIALIDSGGGNADKPFTRAFAFHALGYRVAIVRDDDTRPTTAIESAFITQGGNVVKWRDGCALEDELFLSLSDDYVVKLIDRAIELHGQELVNEHIKTASCNSKDLSVIRSEYETSGITCESREVLGQAARTKRAGWFKSVTWMERVGRDIVAPALADADTSFKGCIDQIFSWVSNAPE